MTAPAVDNLAAGLTVFTSNAFLVSGERPVLVDTGANFDVVDSIDRRDVEPEAIVLTHTHPDHVGNVSAVKDAFDVETWGFDTERDAVDNQISDGDRVQLGDATFLAIHTPGHIDDHLCFYAAEEGVLFVGDLVFQHGGFGRTDLEGGDPELLLHSIERILETVDPELETMHCGHGPSVTDEPYSHIELAFRMAGGHQEWY